VIAAGRLLYDHAAERNLLGTLIEYAQEQSGIFTRLRAEHFDHHAHREIYSELLVMRTAGLAVDNFTLGARLRELDRLGPTPEFDIDSVEFEQLTTYATHPEHAEAHADLVIKLWADRRMRDYGTRLVAAVETGRRDLWPAILKHAEEVTCDGGDPAKPAKGLRLMTDVEVEALKPAQGILGNVLFEDCIAYLFGDSDTWKTFLALSWALCIATGLPWLGRPVRRGPVVYIASEGARGISKRIRAWKHRQGIKKSVDILIVPMPVNLLDRQTVPDLIEHIRAHPRLRGQVPALIVFDTLARSMGDGDENDTPVANQITAATGALKAEFGCCVLLVHHSGLTAGHRMRGNSGFRNNSDLVMRMMAPALPDGQKRTPGDVVTLHSVKSKDEDNFQDVHLTTALEEWMTEELDEVRSLVIVGTDKTPAAAEEAVIMPKSSQSALDALALLRVPATTSEWLAASKLADRTFFDARKDLERRQYVARDATGKGAHYSLIEAGRQMVSAKVREQCGNGAFAPSQLTEVTAAAAEGVYTSAPSHLHNGNGHTHPPAGRPCIKCGAWLAALPDGGGYRACDVCMPLK
jgi:AAA domain/DnaB-like helicase N terminal domain